MNSNRLKAAVVVGVLVLASCAAPPQPSAGDTKEGSGPAAPVSGKTAFWEMYKSAYAWAKDMQPLALESQTVAGIKNEGGNAGMWSATFASPSRREARTFSYSAIKAPPDIYKGVMVGKSQTWSGPTKEAQTFQSDDVAVDSDAAYKTAAAQAANWLKKHPNTEASLALGSAARFPAPVWYIRWGDQKNGYAVYVNAKSGAVVK